MNTLLSELRERENPMSSNLEHEPFRPDTETVTVRKIDRETGQPATAYTPPEDIATVRDTATVTVTKPVDGTKKRRTRSDKGKPRGPRRPVFDNLTLDDLEPEVRTAAEAIRLPGQVFRVISPTEVWVENR